MGKYIDKNLLKYIPKKYRDDIVWLEKSHNQCDGTNVYFLTYKINGKEYNAENSDTVSELNWNAKQTIIAIEDDIWRI
jgi:hypothetical protein